LAKIAFIGAGSVVFARSLICDVLSFPGLADSTLALMDIDPGRLDLIAALASKTLQENQLPAKVESTLDRRRALDGADYVIVMIQVGGLDAFKTDVEIPRRYGIDQTVGDTLGPGGVFRGLRTVPVLVDICRDMSELCPEALLVNYSNPMAINCWGMNAATKIKNVGLCHSVQGTAWQLAGYIGVPYEEVSYWVAGINHMSWFLEFKHNGQDAYPALRRAMDDPGIFAKDRVRFEIMRHFDYFVTESTHHMSEYVPYFRKNREMADEWTKPRWDYYEICSQNWEPFYEKMRAQIRGEVEIEPITRSNEYGSRIIHSIETGEPCRINGTVENKGLITNLPDRCAVEVPILVDRTGPRPCLVGDLPPQCAALDRSNINVQQLAVEAGLEKNKHKAFQAIALDPLTSSLLDLRQIQKMVDEMWEAEQEWLKG
jgi:alpha-galactosidase